MIFIVVESEKKTTTNNDYYRKEKIIKHLAAHGYYSRNTKIGIYGCEKIE